MKKYLFFFLLFYASTSLSILSLAKPFPYLKVLKQGEIEIHYLPSASKIINPLTIKDEEPVLILETFLEKKNKSPYRVYFSPGPSEDPTFIIHKKTDKSWTSLGEFSAQKIFLLGNGTFFTTGRANNMFNMRRKYKINKTSINEVLQPFYYVGIKSKTLRPVLLYRSQEAKETIARLPKNYSVEILLNQGEFYLVKTDFGLTGWLRLSGDQRENGVFREIYFAGD